MKLRNIYLKRGNDMTTFYFVRHGESLFNVKDLVQGWSDSPLTAKGINQAKNLSQFIGEYPIEYVYSSPIHRVYDTARLVFPNFDINTNDALKEFYFGTKEGDPNSTIFDGIGTFDDFVDGLKIGWRDFGGENYDDVINRLLSFMDELSNEYPNGHIAIVSHGCTIAALCDYIEPIETRIKRQNHQDIENCSVTIIEKNRDELKLKVYSKVFL